MSSLSKCLAVSICVINLAVSLSVKQDDQQVIDIKQSLGSDTPIAYSQPPSVVSSESSSSTPNILYILMDDMGYGDISARGAEFDTPNIDSLYKESIVMNKHYIGLVCSPTRAQILTGRFAWNYGTSYQKAFNDATLMSIPAALPTLADLLNEYTNYNSYITGKWQLGSATLELTPLYRGFKHFYGFYTSGITYDDKTEKLSGWNSNYIDWWIDDNVDWDTQYQFSTEVTGQKIMQIIDQNNMENKQTGQDKPWFIYAAFQAVHETMIEVEEKSEGCANSVDDDRRIYCENVLALDDVIGKLTNYLKRNNYWDNTMIVFTSDNGGPGHTTGRGSSSGSCNYPLRGAKGNFFEGGVRTIAFVTGGYIPESQRGTERDEFFHVVDWLPTLLTIAGADVEEIKQDIQTKLYIPVSESLSIQKHGNLKHSSKYSMETSLDGLDLSNWLLYNGDNSRDHVPLSIASFDPNIVWLPEDDTPPSNAIALIFTSSIDGNIYKLIYETEFQDDVIRRYYCYDNNDNNDNNNGVKRLCEDKDSIEFGSMKLLFSHNEDPYESTNLFEEFGNVNNNELIRMKMADKIDTKMFDLKGQYNEELLDDLWNEALDIISSYMEGNAMFNDVLGCQMDTYYDESDPGQFEIQAIQPWFTWDEYVENWENDCKKHANTLLMELFTTRWYQYNSGEISAFVDMKRNQLEAVESKKKNKSNKSTNKKSKKGVKINEEVEIDNEQNKEQRDMNQMGDTEIIHNEKILDSDIVNRHKNHKNNKNNAMSSLANIGYIIGGCLVLVGIFAIYRYFANRIMKNEIHEYYLYDEYTPLRTVV